MESAHTVGDLTVLEAAFAALEQGITIHDRDGRIVVCNPAAARIAGLPLDEILGTRPPRYPGNEVRDESGALVSEEQSGVLRTLRTGESELGKLVELRPNDGAKSRWLRANYQPLFAENEEEPWGVVASVVEVESPRVDACASKTIAPLALKHAPDPILALDAVGLVVHANDAAHALADRVAELAPAIAGEVPLRPILFDRVRYELPTRDDVEDDKPIALACAFDRPDDPPTWLAAKFRPGRPGTQVASVCSIREITEERRREEALAYSALHDPLTGLANRRLIDEHLEIALARANRGEQSVALLFLDLDGFKQINEQFGHNTGDAVLVEFSRRLTRSVRASDAVGRAADPASLVSRPGGDEFMVILSDLSADPGASIVGVIERVRQSLLEPFRVGEVETTIAVSIGAAEYPLDGRDAQTLVERANGMMRAAKRSRA
jgi:diguanylate cyclase (GGDEF)-like protein/PAS domain S-box-containing protein